MSKEIDITLRIPADKCTISPVSVRPLGDARYELRESVLGYEDLGLMPEAIIECRPDSEVSDPDLSQGTSVGSRPRLAFVGVVEASELRMYQACISRRLAESGLLTRWVQRQIDDGGYVFRDMVGVLSVYYRDARRDVSAELDALLAQLDNAEQGPAR